MKRIVLAGLMLAVLSGTVLHAAHADTTNFASPPKDGKQTWFLGMLKTLADSDSLDDPNQVGTILGVKFEKTVIKTEPSHMEAFAKSFERDEYTPIGKTWFTAGPPGYASTGNWKPNGHNGFMAGVDPKATGKQVNFKYFESKRFGLQDDTIGIRADIPSNDAHTTVIFYGIDKLTCVTLQDIQTYFPGIHHMEATDASSERYLYYPAVREESGNVLSFEAPEGKCVTEATVDEFTGFGKRIRRATQKFAKCLQDAGTTFCSKHPDAMPNDFKIYNDIKVYLRKSCGRLDDFYDKEPRNNEAPSEKVDYFDIPSYCPYPDKRQGQ
jgi:hypothetical protein